MNITYAGSDLGQVCDIKENINAGLLPFTMPRTDASQTLIYDLMGTSQTLSVTTKFISTPAGIGSVLNFLDTICNGQQNTSKQLTLPFGRTKNVVVTNWQWFASEKEGQVNTDEGSNCIITLVIDFAYGTVVPL